MFVYILYAEFFVIDGNIFINHKFNVVSRRVPVTVMPFLMMHRNMPISLWLS